MSENKSKNNKTRQELFHLVLALEEYVLNNDQLKPIYNQPNSTFRTALKTHFKKNETKYQKFLERNTLKNYNSIKGDLKTLLRSAFATYFDSDTDMTGLSQQASNNRFTSNFKPPQTP